MRDLYKGDGYYHIVHVFLRSQLPHTKEKRTTWKLHGCARGRKQGDVLPVHEACVSPATAHFMPKSSSPAESTTESTHIMHTKYTQNTHRIQRMLGECTQNAFRIHPKYYFRIHTERRQNTHIIHTEYTLYTLYAQNTQNTQNANRIIAT